jgi:hypothetical protein
MKIKLFEAKVQHYIAKQQSTKMFNWLVNKMHRLRNLISNSHIFWVLVEHIRELPVTIDLKFVKLD